MTGSKVVSCRMSLDEKRLVQALAARRRTVVAHLVRDLLLRELRKEMGKDVLPPFNENEHADRNAWGQERQAALRGDTQTQSSRRS